MSATDILRTAAEQIGDRAEQRDCPGGERSMARTVEVFNALTGHRLTEVDGWQFMQCLKLARSRAGRFVRDDFVDNAAYAALAGEAAQQPATTEPLCHCCECGRPVHDPPVMGRCPDCQRRACSNCGLPRDDPDSVLCRACAQESLRPPR